MSRRRTIAVLTLLVSLQLIGLVAGLVVAPHYLVSTSDRQGLSPPEVVAAEDSVRGKVIAAIASLAVVSSAGVGIVQLSLSFKKQVTDRVSAALAILGSDSVHERTAAIYSLSQLASQAVVENWAIAVTLANLLTGSRQVPTSVHLADSAVASARRLRRPWARVLAPVIKGPGGNLIGNDGTALDPSGDSEWLEIRRPDLHAALRALGSIKLSGLPPGSEFSYLLHYIDARRGLLEGLIFERVSFARCDMTDSVFRGSTFRYCEFRECILPGCDLDRSFIMRCVFTDCDLSGASLQRCRFRRVQFLNCRLDAANVSKPRARPRDIELVGGSIVDIEIPSKLLAGVSRGSVA